jgi:hypothetical protein
MNDQKSQRPLKFRLNKQVVQELGVEEMELVSGGATFSCCVGCHTDGSPTICPTTGA